jgi:4-amino-4-deoxy-L-arabinose transferase-like glycosyltransferase
LHPFDYLLFFGNTQICLTKLMTTENKQQTINNLTWGLWAIVTMAVYFFGLSFIPLLGPDEPRYAQVAREMFERGDWITPTLGGFHWFEKPALAYWLMMIGYKLFGVNEFSARFGSVVFGLLTVFSVYWLGRFIHKELANYFALITASSIGMLVFSHAASFDIILTFPITASLICFYIFESENPPATADGTHNATAAVDTDIPASPRPRVSASLVGFYSFIGLALLAKGLIGFVLPFGIVFWYFIAVRKLPSKQFLLSLIWGNLLVLLVASTWYLPMYWRHGWEFVDEFFIQHHFARYTSNKYLHPEPFYFFWWVLPVMTLPWMPFLLGAIWDFFKKSPCPRVTASMRLFALTWMLVPVVFFTFSGSKLPGYILPAVPAACLLIGEKVWRWVGSSETRKGLIQLIAALTFVVISIATAFFIKDLAQHDSMKDLILKADASGLSNAKVFTLHTISHSLEFYAAGRLSRLADGKQRQFYGIGEIVDEMRKTGRTALVLVPLEHLRQVTDSNIVKAEIIGDNGEYALVSVIAVK